MLQNYTACETPSGGFEVRNNIALTLTVCIASFKTNSKLQRKRLRHSYVIVFSWTDGRMDNSCKQRAYYFSHSFVIVHTKHGQWQASLSREKSVWLTDVCVTDRLHRNFQNSQKSWGN